MSSGVWRVYLSLFAGLFVMTAVAMVAVPMFLDSTDEPSIRDYTKTSRPTSQDLDHAVAIVTRFPTRPYDDRPFAPPPKNPISVDEPSRPAQTEPTEETEQPAHLPTRLVPGIDSPTQSVGERVTTRAWVTQETTLHKNPKTTSAVLGNVGRGSQVRWVAKADAGWEEILLTNGSSAYLKSTDLTFSAPATADQGESRVGDRGVPPDFSALTATTESFLRALGQEDYLRAETFLGPESPQLEFNTLGRLAAYTEQGELSRVARIEPLSGQSNSKRAVLLARGSSFEDETWTVWEWDSQRQRWQLISWDE